VTRSSFPPTPARRIGASNVQGLARGVKGKTAEKWRFSAEFSLRAGSRPTGSRHLEARPREVDHPLAGLGRRAPQPDLVQRRVYGDRVAQQAARPLEALAGLATATQIQLRLPGARVKDVSGSLHRVSPRASSAITLYQRFVKPRHSGSERLHRLA